MKALQNIQGRPERSRQSNWAVFTIEGELDAKFPYLEEDLSFCNSNSLLPLEYCNANWIFTIPQK